MKYLQCANCHYDFGGTIKEDLVEQLADSISDAISGALFLSLVNLHVSDTPFGYPIDSWVFK